MQVGRIIQGIESFSHNELQLNIRGKNVTMAHQEKIQVLVALTTKLKG